MNNYNRVAGGANFFTLISDSGTEAQVAYVMRKNGAMSLSAQYSTVRPVVLLYEDITSTSHYEVNGRVDANKFCVYSDTVGYAGIYNKGALSKVKNSSSSAALVSIDNYVCGFITEDGNQTVVLANVTATDGSVSDIPDGTYYVKYTDNDLVEHTVAMQKVTANVVFYLCRGLDINYNYLVEITTTAPEPTFTNNIPNSSLTGHTWDGEMWQIKITADTGYQFDGAPVLSYYDTNGDYVTLNMTLDTSKSIASANLSTNVDGTTSFTATGATKAAELNVTNNVENTTATSTKSGYSGTITLKANDGYKIDEAKVSFTNGDGDYVTENMAVASDGKTATWSNSYCYTSETFTITGTTSSETVTPTFTNNIPNTSVAYSGSDHQYAVTITAKDGYLFDGTPEASYTGYSSGSSVSVSFVVSSDKKTASGICPDVDESTPIVLTGNTTEEVTITVVNNIEGTTETHTYDGTNLTVTVTGTEGKQRFKNPQMVYTDTTGSTVTVDMAVSLIDEVPTATAQATGVKNGTTVNVNGTFEIATMVKTSLSNCTVDNTPDYLWGGDAWTVVVTANANCLFDTAPQFSWMNADGYSLTQDLVLSSDSKTATGTFTNPSYVTQYVSLYAEATPQTVIGGKYGAINVYKVTLDNLEAFSKKRFFKEAINSDGTEFTLINLGDYVNRIKRLFFTVPVASTDVIKCGNYNTEVECEAPETGTVTLNFGSITVPTPNGDTTDYLSELKLFVPFKGFVSIPVEYIGKTLSLVYTVNVITGGGVAKVLCGDDVVLLLDVEPNEDVIYQTNLDNLATVGGDEWNEQLLYGIEPFLNVRYYNSLNKDERNTDYINGKLGDLSGFCVVDDVTLSTTAEMTADEQERIISLLKQGVYIEQ